MSSHAAKRLSFEQRSTRGPSINDVMQFLTLKTTTPFEVDDPQIK